MIGVAAAVAMRVLIGITMRVNIRVLIGIIGLLSEPLQGPPRAFLGATRVKLDFAVRVQWVRVARGCSSVAAAIALRLCSKVCRPGKQNHRMILNPDRDPCILVLILRGS